VNEQHYEAAAGGPEALVLNCPLVLNGNLFYYVLPSETQHAGRGVRAFASSQIDTWLTFILGHLGVAPPEGETWSGHSLRKGAASASSAIGVSINRICYMGGWSIHGKTYTDYIDPTCPACRASYRFFGWLLPAAMRLK